ncbi:MAG: hypothetical protein R2795_04540 [Saprospiraceae bacterium]
MATYQQRFRQILTELLYALGTPLVRSPQGGARAAEPLRGRDRSIGW